MTGDPVRGAPGWVVHRQRWTPGKAPPQRHVASGWVVQHCGHPTALYPYTLHPPDGRLVTSGCGFAFATVAVARAAVEGIAAGRLEVLDLGSGGNDRYRVAGTSPRRVPV